MAADFWACPKIRVTHVARETVDFWANPKIHKGTSADFGIGLEIYHNDYSARIGHKSGRICVRYLLSLVFGIGFTQIPKNARVL